MKFSFNNLFMVELGSVYLSAIFITECALQRRIRLRLKSCHLGSFYSSAQPFADGRAWDSRTIMVSLTINLSALQPQVRVSIITPIFQGRSCLPSPHRLSSLPPTVDSNEIAKIIHGDKTTAFSLPRKSFDGFSSIWR